jgi:hypothetical protein
LLIHALPGRDRPVDDLVERRTQPGGRRGLHLILQVAQQLRVAGKHETGSREGDHQHRHQGQHAEEGDRRGVVVAVMV